MKRQLFPVARFIELSLPDPIIRFEGWYPTGSVCLTRQYRDILAGRARWPA